MSIINDALKKVQSELKKDKPEKIKDKSTDRPSQVSQQSQSTDNDLQVPGGWSSQWNRPEPESRLSRPDASSQPGLPKKYRTLIQRSFIGFFAILIIAFIAFYFTYLKAEPEIASTPTPKQMPPQRAPSPQERPQQKPRTFSLPIPKFAQAPVKQESTLKINGIMTMGDRHVALINNEIYEKGESINGMKITNISLDSIEVFDGKNTKIFKVK